MHIVDDWDGLDAVLSGIDACGVRESKGWHKRERGCRGKIE
jgi:hypothetical protein